MTATIPDKELHIYDSANTISLQTPFAHSVGTNETIVYNALVSKYFYYVDREKLTEDGFFMILEKDMQESTTLCGKPLSRLMKTLESIGLIKQELRGMPAKKYVQVVHDDKLILRLLNEGLQAAHNIYPKTTNAQFFGDDKIPKNNSEGLLSMFSDKHKLFVNRLLAHAIGLDPAVAWAVINTKYFQCKKYGTLRDDGSFYITEADFEEVCGYKSKKQRAAIKILVDLGLIVVKLSGAPAKRYFQIIVTDEQLEQIITDGTETAKEVYSLTAEAAEIAAKKKQEEELNRHVTPEEEAEYLRQAGYFGAAEQQSFQFVPNGGTSPSEILEQVRSERSNKFVPNGGTREDETAEHTFNHNIYNHDISQSVSEPQNFSACTNSEIIDGRTDDNTEKEKIDDISSAKDILKERIGYEYYRKRINDKYSSRPTNVRSLSQLDLVLDVMLDALERAKDKGYIPLSKNGRVVTYRELQGHFLERIEKRHIEYLFGKLNEKQKSGDIKNIRAYVLTAIYNAVDEADMLVGDKSNSTIDEDKWYEMVDSFNPWDYLDDEIKEKYRQKNEERSEL